MSRVTDDKIGQWREWAKEIPAVLTAVQVNAILDALDYERAYADEWEVTATQCLDDENLIVKRDMIIADYKAAVLTYEAALRERRATLSAIRRLHQQYLPAAVNFDCCSHCNRGNNYVPWPCDTIRILDERKPQR